MLSHTSGFQNWRSASSPLAIHSTPGTQYRYSGEGYNYLQTVVTHLLKQPFERYMRTRLFEPLGMTSSEYVWSDRASQRMTRPHDADGKPFANNRSTPDAVASVAGRSGYVAMTNGDNGPQVLRNLLTADVMQAFLLS